METPRWLYAHDKYEQARTNVRKMAAWSGMEIEEKTFDEFEAEMVSFSIIFGLTQSKLKNSPLGYFDIFELEYPYVYLMIY